MVVAVNIYGLDDTLASRRAVFDAIHHGRLGYARLVGATAVEFVERG
jgi:hypothetical protein